MTIKKDKTISSNVSGSKENPKPKNLNKPLDDSLKKTKSVSNTVLDSNQTQTKVKPKANQKKPETNFAKEKNHLNVNKKVKNIESGPEKHTRYEAVRDHLKAKLLGLPTDENIFPSALKHRSSTEKKSSTEPKAKVVNIKTLELKKVDKPSIVEFPSAHIEIKSKKFSSNKKSANNIQENFDKGTSQKSNKSIKTSDSNKSISEVSVSLQKVKKHNQKKSEKHISNIKSPNKKKQRKGDFSFPLNRSVKHHPQFEKGRPHVEAYERYLAENKSSIQTNQSIIKNWKDIVLDFPEAEILMKKLPFHQQRENRFVATNGAVVDFISKKTPVYLKYVAFLRMGKYKSFEKNLPESKKQVAELNAASLNLKSANKSVKDLSKNKQKKITEKSSVSNVPPTSKKDPILKK